MTDWQTTRYLQFERERTQPAIDLLAGANVAAPRKIIDIGCGPGNSTAVLVRQYPQAEISGMDSSPNMIAKAHENCPGAAFFLCDAGKELQTLNDKYDLVFSNACIQWIPRHEILLANLMKLLTPGGVLAVQVPMNGDAPLFKVIERVVAESRWNFPSAGMEVSETLRPEQYFDILSGIAGAFTMWETVYYHRMASHQDLIDWVKGTRLRPYLNALDDGGKAAFEAEILTQSREYYPVQKNGEIIFRFRRFFFTATR